MILNGVDSNDYIYLRLADDIRWDMRDFHKGTIIRFSISHLRKVIWKREIRQKLFNRKTDKREMKYLDEYCCIELKAKSNVSKQAFLPQDLYESITITDDINIFPIISPEDLIAVNDWLTKKLNSSKFSLEAWCRGEASSIAEFNRKFFENGTLVPSTNNGNALISLNSKGVFKYVEKTKEQDERPFNGGNIICTSAGEVICLPLEKGDVLDLSDPVINLLFMDQEWMRLLLQTEVVPEEEKLKLFERDFAGWIPEAGRRYFKLHKDIKLINLSMIEVHRVWPLIESLAPDFYNYLYNEFNMYSSEDGFDFDSEGYLRYIHTGNNSFKENELSKIAERVSAEEGRLHYEHEMLAAEQRRRREALEWEADEYLKKHKARFYKLQKSNLNLTAVEFMQMEQERLNETKRVLVRRLNNALTRRINDIKEAN